MDYMAPYVFRIFIQVRFFALAMGLSTAYASGALASPSPDYYSQALHHVVSVGAMSRMDFERLNQIEVEMERTHTISDAQLRWSIKLLERKPIRDTLAARECLTTEVVFRLLEGHRVT